MAAKELWDYLSEVVPDYDATLDIKRDVEITEEGEKNQVIHLGDDNSEEIISFSDDSILYANINWNLLKESEAGTIYDFYHDSTKANGMARSFKWIHYGEKTDQHTYTVRFASKMPRELKSGDVHGIKNIKLKILGRAPA